MNTLFSRLYFVRQTYLSGEIIPFVANASHRTFASPDLPVNHLPAPDDAIFVVNIFLKIAPTGTVNVGI